MKKKWFLVMMSLTLAAGLLAGCGGSTSDTAAEDSAAVSEDVETIEESDATEEETADAAGEDAEEEEDTGDITGENIRNQDDIGEKELLVVSFGTSYNDSRRATIGAIEDALEEAFPEYSVRRAFTSNIVIDHINDRDGVLIDDVDAALQRALDNGVQELVVQPTHLMNGLEYDELVEKVSQYADGFASVKIGAPLLTSDEDFDAVEKAIVDWTSDMADATTDVVFMGHGTEAASNEVYEKLQQKLWDDGYDNYYIGTVEATPTLEDVMGLMEKDGCDRVILEPLMVVAGDHANNDMAGDDDDSWQSILEAAGYKVTPKLRGLGENEDIQQLYVAHAKAAMEE